SELLLIVENNGCVSFNPEIACHFASLLLVFLRHRAARHLRHSRTSRDSPSILLGLDIRLKLRVPKSDEFVMVHRRDARHNPTLHPQDRKSTRLNSSHT